MQDCVSCGKEEAYEIASAATSREEIGNDTHWGTKEQLDLHHIPYAPPEGPADDPGGLWVL